MNRTKSYSIAALRVGVTAFLMMLASVALSDEPSGQLIDSPYEAVEASSIVLVVDGGGDIVGIRGKGCPGCPSPTILPARDLVVEAGGGVRLQKKKILELNGMPGVIHIYRPTGMAHRLSFPGVFLSGGKEQ